MPWPRIIVVVILLHLSYFEEAVATMYFSSEIIFGISFKI